MTAETPRNIASTSSDGRLSLLSRDVRDHDPARFQTALFAPATRREDLMALYAFHAELARVAGTVSETIIGQMRFQWWRDQVERACDGEDPILGHPVGEGVNRVIRTHGLDRAALLSLIDARETDLDARPFQTLDEMVEQANRSSGELNVMAARVLGVSTPSVLTAAGDVGTAWGVLGTVRTCAYDAHQGRLTLPMDLCADYGVTVETLAKPESATGATEAVERIVTVVRDRLTAARRARGAVAIRHVPPFLLARLCDHHMTCLKGSGYAVHDPRLLSIPRIPIRLFLAALGKRF